MEGGDLIDDPKFKSFLLCLYTKMNFYRSDGTVNMDVVRNRFPKDLTEDQKNGIINDCLSLKGTDAKDTAYLHFKCYREKTSKTKDIDVLSD